MKYRQKGIEMLFPLTILIVAGVASSGHLDFIETEKNDKKDWSIDSREFEKSFKNIESTPKKYEDESGTYSTIYYDDSKDLWIEVDLKSNDTLRLNVDGIIVSPIAPTSYGSDSILIVNITRSIKNHLNAKLEDKYKNEDERAEKVKEQLSGLIRSGGHIFATIFSQNDQRTVFRITPEAYGIRWANKAQPITVQYTPGITTKENIRNGISLYYPFQYIAERPDKDSKFSLHKVSRWISFGPYLLTTIDTAVSLKAGGLMLGLGLTPSGLPILGVGATYAPRNTFPVWALTVNPVEIVRIMFNPSEFLK